MTTKKQLVNLVLTQTALIGGIAVVQSMAMAAETTKAAPSVETIVVTAQRREQKLQDVGISVSALSSKTLSNLNISQATDIVRAIPSLKFNAYSSAQVVFNIRGVSQNDYGDQQEPPVAVYQDDSYSSSINLASFPIFDLSRAEVLRGPQGTLFGRNATGGAVQFISHAPTKDFEGYVTGTYGSYNQTIIEGALSGSLADNLNGRVSGIYDRDNGYIKSIVPGIPDRGGNNHFAFRGIFEYQATDTVKAKLTLRYMKSPHERQAGLYSHAPACPNAQSQGEFTDPNTTCAFWAATAGPGTTGTGYRNDGINPNRGGNPYRTAETTDSYVDRQIFGSTLKLEAKLGALDLVSITDYQHSKKYYQEGGDASPDGGVFFYQGSKLNQISEEVRASGNFGANQFVVGAFGMIIKGDYIGKFADPFYAYDPTVVFSQRTGSFAFFAQDEYKISDQIKLIGGLRYWHDTKTGSYLGTEPSTGVTIIFNQNQIFPVYPGNPITPASAKQNYRGVTARAEIDYKPSDNILLYLSYNRGSKSGGFTFSTGTPFAGFEQAFLQGIPFKPEVLNAFEFGVKSTLNPTTTLNISAFYYKYDDYQAFAQVGTVQSVINLPAKAYGLEAELNAHPIQGLTLQIGTSFLHSRVNNILLPDLTTIVTHDLPQAPGFSGNALARYEFDLGTGKASLQADAQYSAKSCFTALCAPVEKEAAYFLANTRVGYTFGSYDVAAYVNNVFERRYRVYAFDSSLFAGLVAGVYGKPRTFGLTASYHFGGK